MGSNASGDYSRGPLIAFPTEQTIFQRTGVNDGVVEGNGSYQLHEKNLKASWGGVTVDCTMNNGQWSVEVPALVGTDDLLITANDGALISRVKDVSIGIVGGGWGQSPMFGSTENFHDESANVALAIADPRPAPQTPMVDRQPGQFWGPAYDKGWIPGYLAARFTQSNIPQGFVRFAVGSTRISHWRPDAIVDAAAYGYSVQYMDQFIRAVIEAQGLDPDTYDPLTDRAVCEYVLVHIGSRNARDGIAKETTKTNLIASADHVKARLGTGIYIQVLPDLFATGYVATQAQLVAIQEAVQEAASASANITLGPDFSDVVLSTNPPEQSGNVHFFNDNDNAIAVTRWSAFP